MSAWRGVADPAEIGVPRVPAGGDLGGVCEEFGAGGEPLASFAEVGELFVAVVFDVRPPRSNARISSCRSVGREGHEISNEAAAIGGGVGDKLADPVAQATAVWEELVAEGLDAPVDVFLDAVAGFFLVFGGVPGECRHGGAVDDGFCVCAVKHGGMPSWLSSVSQPEASPRCCGSGVGA